MEDIDPSQDRQKLEELYAEMSDSRLREMANQADDLTEVAQRVLGAELARRGLDDDAPDGSGEEPAPNTEKLVGIWKVKESTDGQSALDFLESEGIPAILGTERIELVDGSHEDEPVIKVLPTLATRAMALLNQRFPPEPEPEEDNHQLDVCPKCHSPEIIFLNLESEPAQAKAAKYNWTCDACGHHWTDDGLEQLA